MRLVEIECFLNNLVRPKHTFICNFVITYIYGELKYT